MAEDDARPTALVLLVVRSCLLLSLLCGCALTGCVVGNGQPDDDPAAAGGEQGNGGVDDPLEGGAGEPPPSGAVESQTVFPTLEPGEPRATSLSDVCSYVPTLTDAVLADPAPSPALLRPAAHQLAALVEDTPEGPVRDAAESYETELDAVLAELEDGGTPAPDRLTAAAADVAAACAGG